MLKPMLTDTAPDYYAVLQVPPDAELAAIRRSYHRLMLALGAHPDHGGDTGLAAGINAAWAVLKDTELRQAYDRQRRPEAPPAEAEPVLSRSAARPLGLADDEWAHLQRHGELRLFGYQAPGDRDCACQRCGRHWVTRNFNGMPARCPGCRRDDWAWQRFAFCFVCRHGFAVADLDRTVAEVRASCPHCRADDWSLRPVVVTCRACATPNRVRRSKLVRAYCGQCHHALGDHKGWDTALKQRWRALCHWGERQLDRWLIRPLGSL
jgi:hypothetical protein